MKKLTIMALMMLTVFTISCEKESEVMYLSENAILAQQGMLCTTDGYQVELEIIDDVEYFIITTQYGKACVYDEALLIECTVSINPN